MIFTSYFGNKNAFDKTRFAPISIALYPPKAYNGLQMKELAPTPRMLSNWKAHRDEAAYRVEYAKILANYNQKDVVRELMALAGNFKNLNYLPDIVLLCYEKPGDFCHRHLVAEWLNAVGYDVEELGSNTGVKLNMSNSRVI